MRTATVGPRYCTLFYLSLFARLTLPPLWPLPHLHVGQFAGFCPFFHEPLWSLLSWDSRRGLGLGFRVYGLGILVAVWVEGSGFRDSRRGLGSARERDPMLLVCEFWLGAWHFFVTSKPADLMLCRKQLQLVLSTRHRGWISIRQWNITR
jgi:hypothetical protein